MELKELFEQREIKELFEKVNELTGRYPNLNKEELILLNRYSYKLSKDCAKFIYDMELKERNKKYGF